MITDKVTFYYSQDNKIEIIYCTQSDIIYPMHTHSKNYVLGFVTEGAIKINLDTGDKVCGKNDFYIIPPNTNHGFRTYQSNMYSMVLVCLPEDLLYDRGMDYILGEIDRITDQLCNKKVLDHELVNIIKDAIQVLYASIVGICNLPKLDSYNMTDESIKQTKELIEDNWDLTISIDTLAEQVFISPYHLVRKFKERMGITPHQFQIQTRIRKTQQLLRENTNITEVALAAGFCDQSHFNKCFHKIVGLTPTEYVNAQKLL